VIELRLPRLSDAMEEGTILRWLKADGETVSTGEELVEIETDKATVTSPAEASGALEIVVPAGSTVAVGTVIARIGSRAQTPPRAPSTDGGEEAASAVPSTVALGDARSRPPGVDPTGPAAGNGSGAAATPLARRIARERGVDLQQLSGSGPRGRITRADVLAAAGETAPLAAAGESAPPGTASDAAAHEEATGTAAPLAGAVATAPPPAARAAAAGAGYGAQHDAAAEFEIQQPSRVQRLIARRMAEAKATIPDFEVATDALMDHVIAMRSQLKQLARDEVIPSVNDFVVKACAVSLRRHPRVNASYLDDGFRLHRAVHVGVAVAAGDALIVPVVRDADRKSLGTIAAETHMLAQRARSGEITPPELSGGTFTVSNLGMFGMTSIRPVINPPQAAIIGVGAIREVLARADDQIVERKLMTLTMSADHRILYGADAAAFLADVKALLESPLRLLL
jgi:pyruvate dehydrogenase E2 component (dihydrolipoamide acetyltransferase)